VAIKIVENMNENLEEILQEYQILTNHGLHPNIPMLFGIHRSVSYKIIKERIKLFFWFFGIGSSSISHLPT
jgi:hypothetical protein